MNIFKWFYLTNLAQTSWRCTFCHYQCPCFCQLSTCNQLACIFLHSLWCCVHCSIEQNRPSWPRDPANQQDYHPVSISNVWCQIATKGLILKYTDKYIQACLPTQFTCGQSAGGTHLIFAVQALLAANPGFVAVRIDVKNAYNEIKHKAILAAIWNDESLHES